MMNLWALPCIISPCKDRRPELSQCSMNTASSCMIHMYYTGGSEGLGMTPSRPLVPPNCILGWGLGTRLPSVCCNTYTYVLYIQTQCTPGLWSWAQYKNTQIPPGMCIHVTGVSTICEVYDLTLQHTGAQSDHRGQEDNKKRLTLWPLCCLLSSVSCDYLMMIRSSYN